MAERVRFWCWRGLALVVGAATVGLGVAPYAVAARRDSPPSRTYGLPPTAAGVIHRLTPEQTQVVTPAGARGLDVSHWQKAIRWSRVAAAGYRFVWAKASEGRSFVDPRYSANRRGAHAVGMRVGGYDFARPSGPTSAAAQRRGAAEASFFLRVTRPRLGQLRPALDMETTGGLGPARLSAWVQGWVVTVKHRLGYEPMIYASPDFWQSALADTSTFAEEGARLWQAQWTSEPPTPAADDWDGRGWTAWQWSDCGGVPGIRGCVDMDVANPTGGLSGLVMGAPRNRVLPTATGIMKAGHRLRAHVGAWGGRMPIRFGVRWSRCDGDGNHCHGEAMGPRHRLTDLDAGHTIRIVVNAVNRYGQTWVEGPPTPPITG